MRRASGLAFLWLGLASIAWHADAASLQVAPISLTLEARQNADALWLSNSGSEPLTAQLRVYRWRQADGEDQLEPTREVIVSPPMIQLPAGEKQLVRVIRLGVPPADVETSYRVIVDELPLPESTTPGAGSARRAGLQFVLRYSLPVFLLPAAAPGVRAADASPSNLEGRLTRTDGKAQLEISNGGPVHAQIADIAFFDNAGQRHAVRDGLAGYVLPGQRRRWAVPMAVPAGAAGTFRARVNGEFTDRTLLQQPSSASTPGGPPR